MPHMEAAEAFRLLWASINNPRSACPDVEIGFVLEQMTQILMSGHPGPEEEKWILARLAFGPANQRDLSVSRGYSLPVLPLPDEEAMEQFFAEHARRDQETQEAVGYAVLRLLESRLIQKSADGMLSLSVPHDHD